MSNIEIFWIEFGIFALILPPTIIALLGAPWVPTPIARVREMLKLANVKPGDKVFDIGCGDGRMVQVAAKEFGADATGVELSPLVWSWAKIRNFFLRSKAKIRYADCRSLDYRNANAIVCYLLPDFLKKVRTKLEREMPHGSRFVSYAFQVEGWKPVHVEPRDPKRRLSPIYVYEMPVSIKAAGSEAKN
ncbi:hypothetical protein COV82_05175 [Candidatus Peregrinibacteria bacterium CG11_big_fil_rev_8_21_14_0_20_46_8]|nr:MAG: hypothetical protein COV82_05175 [Candidatus Peregrinibacteria bacterium CG11_big_fil_rev_8_21_14_0_20_46_8]